MVKEESEKSVEAETRMEPSGNFKGSTRSDSKASFYNSVDVKNLTPAQQKHFKM